MKILNKESLKKCGFKFSEEYDVHYCERWNHGTDEQEGKGTIEVCNKTLKIINIKALGGTGLDLVTKIIYDMVKAGCFDEKSKTLEELGFKIDKKESSENTLLYYNEKYVFIKFHKFSDGKVCYSNNGLLVDKKLNQAIMLKMEELKNDK